MALFTFYLSVYSAITTSLLGIVAFYFARREYRWSGPVVSAKLVRGHFLAMAPFVALAFGNEPTSSFVVPLLAGARIRPPSRQFSAIGVYVQNTGRAPVTVRAISAKIELELSDEYIAEVNTIGADRNQRDRRFPTRHMMMLGTYFTADTPPRRLEPHEGEFWCVSAMEFSGYYTSGDLVGSFLVTFDDGKTCESESFRIPSGEARHMYETYLALVESGEPEPEIVEQKGEFGILVTTALPPTVPSPYLEYRMMQTLRRFFSSSTL